MKVLKMGGEPELKQGSGKCDGLDMMGLEHSQQLVLSTKGIR